MNDNPPEFDSNTVRISVPENVELGTPLYAANARDRDSGKSGIVTYKIASIGPVSSSSNQASIATNSVTASNLFSIDPKSGHITLSRHLDYETAQRHALIITASDSGEPSLSANLTVLVEVQDVNDNAPVFERNEYSIKILESIPINSQVNFKVPILPLPTPLSFNEVKLKIPKLNETLEMNGKISQQNENFRCKI